MTENYPVLIQIIEVIKNKPMSIAEIIRQTGMKRATLIYYINQIEAQGLIKRTRIMEKVRGRPTMIEFDKVAWEKNKEEREKKLRQLKKEVYDLYSKNPLTSKILQIINDNPEISWDKILSNPEVKNYDKKFAITDWLHQTKLIKESFVITESGRKFLEENKSSKT